MWNNYFVNIQHKYSMRISSKSPLIIRYDGKDMTKNMSINFLENYKGSFSNSMENTVQYFTHRYKCFAIFGSDEVSFIIENPSQIIKDCGSFHVNKIMSLFSQYFFDYFNHYNKHTKIFWHGDCFSIPIGKINSYIKYRSGIIKSVMPVYFLKRKNIKERNMKLSEMIEKCKQFEDYKLLENVLYGTLYFNGQKIDLNKYLKEGIVKVNDDNVKKEDIIIDLSEIEWEDNND